MTNVISDQRAILNDLVKPLNLQDRMFESSVFGATPSVTLLANRFMSVSKNIIRAVSIKLRPLRHKKPIFSDGQSDARFSSNEAKV